MLSVHSISKSYGIVPVLKEISFNLNRGEKIGLVGPNGCGKTTLLKILAGLEKADSGSFSVSGRTGYLAQALEVPENLTVAQYIERMEGNQAELLRELQEVAAALTRPDAPAHLQQRYNDLLLQIESASTEEGEIQATLAAFELDKLPPDLPVSTLSGGQKTRLGLAGLLLTRPDLLLLDEPTNHLDFAMLEWLEDWVHHSQAAVLLVSHDRVFLDATMDSIFEIDPASHTGRLYAGNFSDYLAAKAAERAQQWQDYADQQAEIKRLQAAARHYREIATFTKGGKADTPDKFAKAYFANRGLRTVRRAKSVEKRVDQLLGEDAIEKPRASWQMHMQLAPQVSGSRMVLTLKDLSIGYGETALLSHLNQTIRLGERVVLIGPNGSGKSTLMRTLGGLQPALGGEYRLGASVKPGYMAQDQGENLRPDRSVLATLQSVVPLNDTAARALLHQYLFAGDEALLPVEQCSYGMRARLVLACLVAQGCNFLLLDEPLNHLDIPSRTQFENALSRFEGTLLVVTHDRYFMQRFASTIWEIRCGELQSYLPFWQEEGR